MGVIFVGSTTFLSSEQTSRFIGPFLRWLRPGISDAAIARVHFAARKCGHLTEFAVLSVLLWRAIRQSQIRARGVREWSLVAWAFFWSALYAVSDEYHQSLVSTRFASAWDVGIDALGAALGLALVWWKGRRQ